MLQSAYRCNAPLHSHGLTGRFMSSTASLSELVRRLRTGDDTLADELFQRYARRLIGLARTHLDSHLRQKVDPEDVVQSVYKSFFRRLEAEQVEALNWD